MDFCFPKAWDVRKRLQLSLARKFLSLSERDRESRQNVDARYRLAIMETAEKVTGDAFSGFLGAISASFKLIISTIFMLVAAGEAAPHMFVVILIIIAVSFFILSLRTPGTWRLWKEGHTTKQRLYSELFFVTDNWRLIREEKREDRAAASLKQAISDALVGEGAVYNHTKYTGIWAKGIVTAVVYAMWALAPWITGPTEGRLMTTGTYIAILNVLGSFGSSWIGLQTSLLKVYTSGSMVHEVSLMLNSDTEQTTRLRARAAAHHVTRRRDDSVSGEEAIRDAKKARDEIAAEINTERAHGASDADGADLALILESTSSQRFAFRLQAVSYTTPSGDAVFDGLTLAYHDAVLSDARLRSLVKDEVSGRAGGGFVPAGGLIALRADGNGGGAWGRAAELTMCRLLSGALKPQAGTAAVLPSMRVAFVGQRPTITRESLLHNLLYGLVSRDAIEADGTCDAAAVAAAGLPDEKTIWELCARVGLSAALIGARYAPGWGAKSLEHVRQSASFVDELPKIALVRALLHTPEVIILHRVGDLWDLNAQQTLRAVVRDFLSGELSSLTEAGKPWVAGGSGGVIGPQLPTWRREARTVVWATHDAALAVALEKDDLVLDVTAPNAALLSKAADWAGFAGNFEGYRAELQKLYGAPPAAPPPAPVEAAAPAPAPAVGSGRIDVDRVDIYEFPTAAPAPAEASGTQSRV